MASRTNTIAEFRIDSRPLNLFIAASNVTNL
jgi:hypothetical protein